MGVGVGSAPVCPAQIPHLSGDKVARATETTCSSCTPGPVLKTNPELEGPGWRKAPASPIWESGSPKEALQPPSRERLRPPTLHALGASLPAAQGADSRIAQVPSAPTPECQARCFCGFFFSPQAPVFWKRGVGSCVHCPLYFSVQSPADMPEKLPVVSLPGFVLTSGRNITSDLSTLRRRRSFRLEEAYFYFSYFILGPSGSKEGLKLKQTRRAGRRWKQSFCGWRGTSTQVRGTGAVGIDYCKVRFRVKLK